MPQPEPYMPQPIVYPVALMEVGKHAADVEDKKATATTDMNFEVSGNINIGTKDTLAGDLEWATATLYNGKVEGNMQQRFESGMSAKPSINVKQAEATLKKDLQ